MSWRKVAIAVLVVVAGLSTAAHAAGGGYSGTPVRLGMTLDEFRKTKHPDQDDWPSAYSVCSNEPRSLDQRYVEAKLTDESLIRAEVVKCAFFYDSWPFGSIHAAGLRLGKLQAHATFYFMRAEPQGSLMLFWILVSGPSENFETATEAMIKTFGPPAATSEAPVQNKAGTVFKNIEHTWGNAVTRAKASRYGAKVTMYEVSFTLTPVMKLMVERMQPPGRVKAAAVR